MTAEPESSSSSRETKRITRQQAMGCLALGYAAILMICVLSSLAANKASNENPAWSPDGRQIAFSSYRRLGPRICIMNADGGNLHCATAGNMIGEQPAWSPDGGRIAFTSAGRVCVMDTNGNSVHCLTDASLRAYYPTWSPDGNQIAFLSVDDKITATYIVDVDGNNLRHLIDCFGNAHTPWPIAWSLDGRRIVFAANPGIVAGHGEEPGATALYAIDTTGDNLQHLAEPGYSCLTLSRDGTEIITCARGCYTVSVAGSESRRVADAPKLDEFPFLGLCTALSPDNSQIAFAANQGGDYEIFTMNADGSHLRRLTYYSVWDRLLRDVPLVPFIESGQK